MARIRYLKPDFFTDKDIRFFLVASLLSFGIFPGVCFAMWVVSIPVAGLCLLCGDAGMVEDIADDFWGFLVVGPVLLLLFILGIGVYYVPYWIFT